MSSNESTNNTVQTTEVAAAKKPQFASALAPTADQIAAMIADKRKADLKFEQDILKLVKQMVTESTKREKALDRYTKRDMARKSRPKKPAHSVVGVNQPKSLNAELVTFLRANADKMPEKAKGMVNDIMSLNHVKQCVQSLASAAGVITKDSNYDFRAEGADASFVSSMRRLLIDLVPAGYYKDAEGNVIGVNFDEKIKTNKITKFFDHLLSTTDASKAFTAQKIAELTEKAAAAAAAAATASTEEAAAPAPVVVAAAAPVAAVPEPEVKKRRIVPKKAAAATA
jgi:hypothetical protein